MNILLFIKQLFASFCRIKFCNTIYWYLKSLSDINEYLNPSVQFCYIIYKHIKFLLSQDNVFIRESHSLISF